MKTSLGDVILDPIVGLFTIPVLAVVSWVEQRQHQQAQKDLEAQAKLRESADLDYDTDDDVDCSAFLVAAILVIIVCCICAEFYERAKTAPQAAKELITGPSEGFRGSD